MEPANAGVPEGEHAPVGGHQPVARGRLAVAAMPTTGALRWIPPVDPSKAASP